MLSIPVIRWGKPYESLEWADVAHFNTGEPIARVSQANGGLILRDGRQARAAREALRRIPSPDLIAMCQRAGELFEHGTLPMGNGTQTPDEFVHAQSASTGLPEHMCRANIKKNAFVLTHIDQILDALTRGLPLDILSRGYGIESRRVVVSYQAQTAAMGAVLPSNSPGVHTLWLPVIPLQIGLMLKPGSQEPWTPYRVVSAFRQAGVPPESMSVYPGGHDTGPAILSACDRSMVFGGAPTVAQYHGNPRVQAHGPGFSKIILGDDVVDQWETYLDIMVESIMSNGGRSCINCSGIWASRHTREIAQALATRLGPVDFKPPTDPTAELAAFTAPDMAEGVWGMVQTDMGEHGVTDMTAGHGTRFTRRERYAYIRPVILHCESADCEAAKKEYMFPFATIVTCPQDQMLKKIGPTLVCTAITRNQAFVRQLGDAVNIDRLNVGPIPTNRLNWLQPHEGNLIDFLFRSRAYQVPEEELAALST